MFFRLLKSYQPYVIILLPFIVAALWLRALSNPSPLDVDTFNQVSPLSLVFSFSKLPSLPILFTVIGLGLFIILSFLLVFMNNRFIFIEDRTYLHAFFFIFIVSGLFSVHGITATLIGSFFVIWSLNKLFSIYKEANKARFFDMGITLSIASLFNINFVFVLPLLFIGASLIKTFSLREWFLTLLGFALPFLFMLFYFWYFNIFPEKFTALSNMLTSYHGGRFIDNLSKYQLFYYGFISLLLLRSLLHVFSNFFIRKIRVRKYYNILFGMLLFSVLILLMAPAQTPGLLLIFAIPASYFLTDYFLAIRRNWIKEFLMFLVIGGLVFILISDYLPVPAL